MSYSPLVYRLSGVIPLPPPPTYTCTRVKVRQKILPSLCIVLFSLTQPIFEDIFLENFLIYIVAFIPVLLLALSCDFCIYGSTKIQATMFGTCKWLCRLRAIQLLPFLFSVSYLYLTSGISLSFLNLLYI